MLAIVYPDNNVKRLLCNDGLAILYLNRGMAELVLEAFDGGELIEVQAYGVSIINCVGNEVAKNAMLRIGEADDKRVIGEYESAQNVEGVPQESPRNDQES
jgi:hypothetical protein